MVALNSAGVDEHGSWRWGLVVFSSCELVGGAAAAPLAAVAAAFCCLPFLARVWDWQENILCGHHSSILSSLYIVQTFHQEVDRER